MLLDRLILVGQERAAQSVYLTASSNGSAFSFFKKKGFQVTSELKDKYAPGVIENVMQMPIPPALDRSEGLVAALPPKKVGSPPPLSSLSVEPAKSPVRLINLKSFQSASDLSPAIQRTDLPGQSFLAKEDERDRRDSHYDSDRHSPRDGHFLGRSDSRRDDKSADRQYYSSKESRSYATSGRDEKRGSSRDEDRQPVIKCTLKLQYIKAMQSGKKHFEGRIATPYFSGYQPGKIVEWNDQHGNNVVTEITSRSTYTTFREMLEKSGYINCVPEARSLDHAVELYNKVPGYAEKALRFGVLALGVRVLSFEEVEKLIRDGRYTPSTGGANAGRDASFGRSSGHLSSGSGMFAARSGERDYKRKDYADLDRASSRYDDRYDRNKTYRQ